MPKPDPLEWKCGQYLETCYVANVKMSKLKRCCMETNMILSGIQKCLHVNILFLMFGNIRSAVNLSGCLRMVPGVGALGIPSPSKLDFFGVAPWDG